MKKDFPDTVETLFALALLLDVLFLLHTQQEADKEEGGVDAGHVQQGRGDPR